MSERSVCPRQCALAIGIPTTREQFLADLECGENKDFSRSRLRLGYSPEEFWDLYKGFNDKVLEAADTLEKLGGTACRAATLDDLRALLESHRAVTLLTHHVFKPIEPQDVLDCDRLLQRLLKAKADPDDEQVTAVDRCLSKKMNLHAIKSVQTMAEELNRVVERVHKAYLTAAEPSMDTAAAIRYLANMPPVKGPARAQVEDAYPDWIWPAPCIEMADRLCSIPELIDAIPCSFDGDLDLTVCNAIVPAEIIKRHRRSCSVHCTFSTASGLFRAVIYQRVILELEKQPRPYMDVLTRIHEALMLAVQGANNVST